MAYARNPTWQDGEGLTLITALKLNTLEDNLVIAAQEADDALAAVALRALATTTMTAGTGLTGGGSLAANRTFAVAYGTTSTTACVGNDARLSDARTPLTHVHSGADITSGTVAAARLGVGTTNSSTFLRGDGAWVAQAQAVSLAAGFDLNNATSAGFYMQTTSANATLALNYPETKAGSLLVQNFNSGIITQQYQTFSPDGTVEQYFRSYYSTPATWGPWQRISKSTHNHISTDVTDFVEAVQDVVGAFVVAGTNVTKTYDDAGNTLTIAASGGGGGGFPATYSGGPASANVSPPGCNAAGTGRAIGNQPAGGRIVWFPFDLGACTINGFACNVTLAGNGAAVIKVGIWDDRGGVRPKTLLATLGSAVATSTGIKTVTGSSYAWPGGRLWVGAVEQGHTSVCAEVTHDYATDPVATTQAINNPYSAIGQDGVSGVLPTTPAENALTDMRPRIWLVIT